MFRTKHFPRATNSLEEPFTARPDHSVCGFNIFCKNRYSNKLELLRPMVLDYISMTTEMVPISYKECSILQSVYLSSIYLCCCQYVSIACMANPPPQFQSTHGRGRIQRDTSGKHKTPVGHKTRDSGKHRTPEDKQSALCKHRHYRERPAHP